MKKNFWVVVLTLVLVFSLGVLLTGCSKPKPTVAPPANVVEETATPEPPAKTETTFFEAHEFSDGVVWVRPEEEGLWEARDSSGTILFTLAEGETPNADFAKGVAPVSYPVVPDEHTGGNATAALKLIDKNGKTIFPKTGDDQVYTFAGFLNGYTIVDMLINTPDLTSQREGILAPDGSWGMEPTEELDAKDYGDYTNVGILYVYTSRDRTGDTYFDTNTGKPFTMPYLSKVWSTVDEKKLAKIIEPYIFSDGLVLMGVSESGVEFDGLDFRKIGYKRTFPRPEDSSNYYGGTAVYAPGGKLAFNLHGYGAIKAVGDKFSAGYLSVTLNNDGFYTIIDHNYKRMFEPVKGNGIYPFSNGLALVDPTPESENDADSFYIDVQGNTVIENILHGGLFGENGLARVQFAGSDDGSIPGYNFIDRNGNIAF